MSAHSHTPLLLLKANPSGHADIFKYTTVDVCAMFPQVNHNETVVLSNVGCGTDKLSLVSTVECVNTT